MKNSTALLIIDMQEGFITKETQHVGVDIHNAAIEILKRNIGEKNIV